MQTQLVSRAIVPSDRIVFPYWFTPEDREFWKQQLDKEWSERQWEEFEYSYTDFIQSVKHWWPLSEPISKESFLGMLLAYSDSNLISDEDEEEEYHVEYFHAMDCATCGQRMVNEIWEEVVEQFFELVTRVFL